jgi:hypothetical protein
LDTCPEENTMGIFGFGKKEKQPFKTPREVSALRTRIETEHRENFPNLGRYQELAREAEQAYAILNAIIAEKAYAEVAGRTRDDIRNRLALLAEKIKKNRKDAEKENKEDYLEKNIDYLQRKSLRNGAKTLFTDFLEQIEALKKCCREERLEHGRTMNSITEDLISTLSSLNDDFFMRYGSDKDIQRLKSELLHKLSDLNVFFDQNKARLADAGLEASAASNMMKIMGAAKNIPSS